MKYTYRLAGGTGRLSTEKSLWPGCRARTRVTWCYWRHPWRRRMFNLHWLAVSPTRKPMLHWLGISLSQKTVFHCLKTSLRRNLVMQWLGATSRSMLHWPKMSPSRRMVLHWLRMALTHRTMLHWFKTSPRRNLVIQWLAISLARRTTLHWLRITLIRKPVLHWLGMSRTRGLQRRRRHCIGGGRFGRDFCRSQTTPGPVDRWFPAAGEQWRAIVGGSLADHQRARAADC